MARKNDRGRLEMVIWFSNLCNLVLSTLVACVCLLEWIITFQEYVLGQLLIVECGMTPHLVTMTTIMDIGISKLFPAWGGW